MSEENVPLSLYSDSDDTTGNTTVLEHSVQCERPYQTLRPEETASRCSVDRGRYQRDLVPLDLWRGAGAGWDAINEPPDRSPPKKELCVQERQLRST